MGILGSIGASLASIAETSFGRTPFGQLLGLGGDILGAFSGAPAQAAGLVPSIANTTLRPLLGVPMPSGPTAALQPVQTGLLNVQTFGQTPGGGPVNGGMMPTGPGCPALFGVPSPTAARPIREINAVNPVTGRIEFWRHMGRPLLFAGDLQAVKRVKRVAAKARRRFR